MSIESCLECGTQFSVPSNDGSSATRTACPACGSLARTASMAVTLSGCGELSADLSAVRYEDVLMTLANALNSDNEHGVAVVVAHIACEIAVQRAIEQAFLDRGITDLQASVMERYSGFNLANDSLRKLYTALTGDSIENQQFWASFKESAGRRNRMAHKGIRPSQQEAALSLVATQAFLAHLRTP